MTNTGWARAAGLLAGLAADAVWGDPPNRWHPVAWFGTWAHAIEQRTYRNSVTAGIGHVTTCVAPIIAIAVAIEAVGRRNPWARFASTAVTTWAVMGAHSLAHQGDLMADRLDNDDLDAARANLGYLCGRDPDDLSAPELARATIESMAENTADSAVASLMWGAVLGVPGLALHRAINTLDAMIGHHNDRYERFGKAAARTDDALDWLPARLTGLLATLASRTPSRTWAVMRRDAHKHPSPNGGWCEAAWAAGLGVQLGGTNTYYGGRVEHRGILNAGGNSPDADTVRAAARLVTRVTTAAGALMAAVAAAISR